MPSNFCLFLNTSANDVGVAANSGLFTTTFTALYGLAIAIVLTVGVVANLAVIFVISRTNTLQTTTNIHLIGLCITDCIHLASAPILLSVLILQDFVFNDFVCKSYMLAQGVNWFAGTFLLNSMSVHRYLSVRKPRARRILHRKRCAILTVILLWVLAFTLLSPLAIFSTKHETRFIDTQTGEKVIKGACVINWRTNLLPSTLQSETNLTTGSSGVSGSGSGGGGGTRLPHLSLIFSAYTFIFGFLLPVVINIVVYSLLVNHVRLNRQRVLRRQGRFAHSVCAPASVASTVVEERKEPACGADSGLVLAHRSVEAVSPPKQDTDAVTAVEVVKFVTRSERKRRKLSWKVASLVLIYVTFWAPYWTQQIFLMFLRDVRFFASPRLAFITQLLGYCNSAVNPILYACLSTPFRRSLAKALFLKCDCGWGSDGSYNYGRHQTRQPRVKKEHECALRCCPYLCRCFCDY
ncbi:Belongs to the G-protein coupled receptor 1 [Sparganum proliferum]